MKKLPIVLSVLLTLGLAGAALAASYPPSITSVYCWDTGSYWIAQRAQYPDYYAKPANIAKYSARYGVGTKYCP